MAERNKLKIGDYLTAHSYSVEDQGFTGREIKVQIIGLFTPNEEITAVLKESAHTFGKCVVVVTHDREVAKQADVVLEIKRGHLKAR